MNDFLVRKESRYTDIKLLCASLLWLVICNLATTVLADEPANADVLLTPEEQAWLADHPVIRLAPDPDFPPIEFIDEAGNYRGIAADYAELVEQKLGIKFEIVHLRNWDEVLEKAQLREIDMFGAASESPQRAQYMLFTQPHIQLPGAIIASNGADGSITLDDLQQKKVGVVSGYIWQDLIRNDYPDMELQKAADLKTGLKDVSFGYTDAMVANLATASWYIQREGITNLRVAGESGYFGRYAFAIRKDWPEFHGILEKALAEVTAEEHAEVLARWIHIDSEVKGLRLVITAFVSVLVLSLIISLVIFTWNRALKRKVALRTAALEVQLEQRRKAEQALDQARLELEQRVIDRTSKLEQSNQQLRHEMDERERIQEDLRRFKMTLDKTLDCVFMFDDAEFRFFYVNQGAIDQVGYSRQELLQMHSYDIKPEFNATQFRDFIQPLLEKREASLTFETIHQHQSGKQIPVEIFLQYIAPVNEPARFVAFVRDITERKRMESKLSWNNRELDVISQAQSAFISNTDSRAAFEMLLKGLLELSESEYGFIGEVLHTEDEEPYLRTHAITNIAWDETTRKFYDENAPQGMIFKNLDTLFGAALKTGQAVIANDPANDERSGGLPHGHPALDAFLGVPLYAGQEMVGLAGVANRAGGYDENLVASLQPFTNTCASLIVEYRVSQQHLATEELIKQNEIRMRAVLDNVLEGIITINQSGVIESINPATEDIFGYTSRELMGQNVKMLMPEPDRSAHDQYLKNYQHTRQEKIIGTDREVEGRRKDGSLFPMELSVTEISVAGRVMYVGVVRDITERKQNEAALIDARKELQRANEKLLEQATTDALTGLANRRQFDRMLEQELNRAGRVKNSNLSLILCDIDYFKLYNDSYGHLAGDKCLQQVASTLKSTFKRNFDYPARYGGEEFAVILPATDKEGALIVAERLRRNLWVQQIPHGASLIADRLTLSIGVTTLPPGNILTKEQFIAIADEALYMAKANGRNCVELVETKGNGREVQSM